MLTVLFSLFDPGSVELLMNIACKGMFVSDIYNYFHQIQYIKFHQLLLKYVNSYKHPLFFFTFNIFIWQHLLTQTHTCIHTHSSNYSPLHCLPTHAHPQIMCLHSYLLCQPRVKGTEDCQSGPHYNNMCDIFYSCQSEGVNLATLPLWQEACHINDQRVFLICCRLWIWTDSNLCLNPQQWDN